MRRWLELTAELARPATTSSATSSSRRSSGAWPIERRAARGLHGEGAARGQAHDELGRARRGARGGGAGVLRARCTTHEAFLADFEPFAAEVAARRRPRGARPAAAQAHGARACPTSTRATSCSRSRSSIPTTAGRSTGSCAARLLDEVRRGAAPTRRDAQALADRARAACCAAAARRRSPAPTRRSTPARATVAFLRGDAVLAAAAVRGDGDPVDAPGGPLARRPGRRRARRRHRASSSRDGIALLERGQTPRRA